MLIFLITIIYFSIVSLGILAIIKLYTLIPKVRTHKNNIDAINDKLYADLRLLQFKVKNISNYANALLKKKNSLLGELIPSTLIYLLPFKKIKSILLLMKLAKKIF